MRLDKEDFEWLRDNADKDLTTTYFFKYKRNSPISITNKVADILDKVTNGKCQRNFSCGSCIYNIYNRMAQIYFTDKEEMEKKEEETKKKRQENMRLAREAKLNKNNNTDKQE